jgi:hypothetical protein
MGGMGEWKCRLCAYLEDFLVDNELVTLVPIIREIQGKPRVFKSLAELAHSSTQIDSPFIRKELRDTGLVYIDHDSGEQIVPGSLIRQWIRHLVEDSLAVEDTSTAHPKSKVSSSVRLEVLGNNPYDGLLRFVSAAGEIIEISVSGAPWRVLRCLSGAEGNPVPVGQLAKEANLGTVPATRSAIQRLQQLLKRNGFVNVIDNVRGVGYRLRSFPVLSQDTASGNPLS